MLIDARTLPANEELHADVCIVGAGPAGITIALELLGSGCRICLLESGGQDPGDDPFGLETGESVGYPYFRLQDSVVRAFGGTSRHWYEGEGEFWHACPLDGVDFEPREGIAHSGWPFGRAEIVPFYRRAEALCGLEPFDYAEGEPLSKRLDGAGDRLVVRRIQVASAMFGTQLDRLATADDVQLVLNATAAELLPGEGLEQVGRVRALTEPGRELTISARLVILAAGGLENPRLLLASTRSNERRLGNRNDLVGRFFMEHLSFGSGRIVPRNDGLLQVPELTWKPGTLYTRDNVGRVQSRAPIALAEPTLHDERLLNVAFLLEVRSRTFASRGTRSLLTLRSARSVEPRAPGLARHAGAVLADLPNVVRAALQARSGTVEPDEVLYMRVLAEQQPNRDSRVTLDTTRNGLGLPRVRLDWRHSPLDLESVRRAQDILGDAFRKSGLGDIEDKLGEREPILVGGHYHHMGTTRMDSDPRRGVVDGDGRVHGVANLYAAGSSVFPTSGWANPTLTIVALSIRLADHVRGRLAAA